MGQGPDPKRHERVVFVGNTNCYPLMLSKALHDLGHDVTHIIDRKEALHRPENRYPQYQHSYPDWIVDLSSRKSVDLLFGRHQRALRTLLGEGNFAVLNGYGPAIARRIRNPYFCLFTGADLTSLCDWHSIGDAYRSLRAGRSIGAATIGALSHGALVASQRRGVRHAKGLSFFPPGVIPAGDHKIESLAPNALRYHFQLSDADQVTFEIQPQPTRFKIVNAARLSLRQEPTGGLTQLDLKRSDLLLDGFAQFQAISNSAGELHLYEKFTSPEDQPDVLGRIASLGLNNAVVWHPEVTQHQMLAEMATAHVVVDQLGNGFIGMVTLDALALGRPVIANVETARRTTGSAIADRVLHASTSEDICQHLVRLSRDRKFAVEVGRLGANYISRHCSPEAAAEMILAALRNSGEK